MESFVRIFFHFLFFVFVDVVHFTDVIAKPDATFRRYQNRHRLLQSLSPITDDDPFITIGQFASGLTTSTVRVSNKFDEVVAFAGLPEADIQDWPVIRIQVDKDSSNNWSVEYTAEVCEGATAVLTGPLQWMVMRPGLYKFRSSKATILVGSTAVPYDCDNHEILFTSTSHTGQIFTSQPLVITQVQAVDETGRWASSTVHSVTENGFEVRIGRQCTTGRVEMVGWVAFDPVVYTIPNSLLIGTRITITPFSDRIYAFSLPSEIPVPQCGGIQLFVATNHPSTTSSSVPRFVERNGFHGDVAFKFGYGCPTVRILGPEDAYAAALVYVPGSCEHVTAADVSLELQTKTTLERLDEVFANASTTLIALVVGSLGCCVALAIGGYALHTYRANVSSDIPPTTQQTDGFGLQTGQQGFQYGGRPY